MDMIGCKQHLFPDPFISMPSSRRPFAGTGSENNGHYLIPPKSRHRILLGCLANGEGQNSKSSGVVSKEICFYTLSQETPQDAQVAEWTGCGGKLLVPIA